MEQRTLTVKEMIMGTCVGTSDGWPVIVPAGTYPIHRGSEWTGKEGLYIIGNVPHENPLHRANGHTVSASVYVEQ